MRSRYAAYAIAKVSYILQTTHRTTRSHYNAANILQWAQASTWQKLEIISKQAGTTSDFHGKVEFKAYYLDDQKRPQIHHEHSSFKKEDGQWFFVDGKVK
jgi:SEC-C motif-containing protein